MMKIQPLHVAIAAGVVVLVGGGILYAMHRSAPPQINLASGANPETAKKIDALTAAVESGAITQQDYEAKVAALVGGNGGANPNAPAAAGAPPNATRAQQFDALNSALDSGLITKEEYDAKMAALTGGAAPMAQQMPAGEVQASFQDKAIPTGGNIVAGSTAQQASPQAAIGAVLRRLHAEFGARPTVTQTANNPADHSVAVFFTASRNGEPIAGMAIANATPGAPASVVALYDDAQRFPSTLGPMLQHLQAMTSAQTGGGPSGPAMPAEPLQTRYFSDGTGSIDVPADWTLKSGGGGSAAVVGPNGEIVSYNLAVSAMDPNNRMAQNYLNMLPPQNRQFQLQTTAMLAYSGNPVQTWTTIFNQLARQKGNAGPSFTVANWQNISPGQGINLAEISGEVNFPADGKTDTYLAYVQVTPPNNMGQWMMTSTWVAVPDNELLRTGNTAVAILASVHINFGAVAAQSAAIRNMFQQKFETMIATAQREDAARQERTDEFLANDAIRQDEMRKQAQGWINFAGDRTTVVNTTTGEHNTIDNQFANSLLRDDPNYQAVPPSELLHGVDY